MDETTNVKDDELLNESVNDSIDDDFDSLVNGDEPNESQDLEDETDVVAGTNDNDSNDSEPDEAEEAKPSVDIEALKRERDEWMHRAKADAGRVSALTKKQNELLSQIRSVQQQPAPTNPESSGMSDAQWKEFSEEYPEIARAMEIKQRQLDAQQMQIKQQLAQMTQTIEPIRQKAEQERIQSQYSVLESKHPDWKDIAASSDFKEWIAQQPQPMQAYLSSQDANEASYLLDVYKAMRGGSQVAQQPAKDSRKDRLRQNVGVKSRSGGISAGIPDDFEAAFDFYANS